LIVAVSAFLSSLGTNASSFHNIGGRWIFGALFGALFAVGGFALAVIAINWAGKTFFEADVTFEELVRTLGLAYVWNAVGFLGIIALAGRGLSCVAAPISFAAGIAGLVSWFIAAKEALDLEWPQTIGTVIIGWVVMLVVSLVATVVLSLIGLAGAGIGALFGAFQF